MLFSFGYNIAFDTMSLAGLFFVHGPDEFFRHLNYFDKFRCHDDDADDDVYDVVVVVDHW